MSFKMKMPISTILLCFFISEISAYNYTLTEIKGINMGQMTDIQTDAKENIYGLNGGKLYKLNSSNEISSIDLPHVVNKMIVSSSGDIYFLFWNESNTIFAVLRAGSTKIQEIDQQSRDWLLGLDSDNNGNFFYTKKEGIFVFRPRYNASVLIKNLEGYNMDILGEKATDKSGNSYLPVTLCKIYSIAKITKETLEEEIPQAHFIPYNQSNPGFTYIKDVVVDDEDNLWVISASDSSQYQVSILETGNFKTVLTYDQKNTRLLRTMPSKGKIYLTAYNYENKMVESLHCVTSNGEAVEITEFKNFSARIYYMFGVSDSEGQVYFFNVDSSTPGAAVTIKKNETKPIPITFPISQRIYNAKVDFEDNLWILQESGIYHLKKGETVPQVLPQLQKLKNCYIKHVNSVAKKIYISCRTGYFVIE